MKDHPEWRGEPDYMDSVNPMVHRPGSHQIRQLMSLDVKRDDVQWQIAEAGFVVLSWGVPICPWCYSVFMKPWPAAWHDVACDLCRKTSCILVALDTDPWDWIVVLRDKQTEKSQWLCGGLI